MKNILLVTAIILAVLMQDTAIAQYTEQWDINRVSVNATHIKFLNAETGYIAVKRNASNNSELLKTTNKGQNWTSLWQGTIDDRFTFDIVNGNILHLYHLMMVYRSTDEGQTWYIPFNMEGIVGTAPSEKVILKFINENTGYISYVNNSMEYPDVFYTLYIFKTYDGGQSWSSVYERTGYVNAPYKFVINDFTSIGNDLNHIFFVGNMEMYNDGYKKSKFTIETLDGFNSNPTEVTNNLNNDCECLNGVVVLPNSPSQTRIIVSKYKYNDPTFADNGMYCRINNADYKICGDFLPSLFGGMSYSSDDKGYSYMQFKIYNTSNSGQNWTVLKDQLPINSSFGNGLVSFGDVIYAVSDDGYFIKKHLSSTIKSYTEFHQEFSGGMTLNGLPYPTPFNYYLGGGQNLFLAHDNYTDKVFYKWNDGYLSRERNINVLNDNFELSSNYKTKNLADNSFAITNPNQVKSIRDSAGTLHQVHESIGGIFYSRSTNNGASFQTEEVVNSGTKWTSDFPNDISSSENRNPSLCEIRDIQTGKALSLSYPYSSVAASWQHYNSGNNKMEIRAAIRAAGTNGINPDWHKFGTTYSNLHGVIKDFSASSGYQSKPVVFVSHTVQSALSEPYYYLFLVPHLEPSTNGGSKIVVTARCRDYGIQPTGQTGSPYDFLIADGDANGIITDYAVTAIPTFNQNPYNGYNLHFVYKKGETIIYKTVLITLASAGGVTTIYCPNLNPGTETLSIGDNMLYRYTPDISVRNGRPAVAYKGYKIDYRYVVNEENNDDPQMITLHHYPVIVKYKKSNGLWSESTVFDGLTQQDNPNIEGSRNADAYLLNFRKNNANYQFVKIENYPGFSCSPGVSYGTDAKLVKNCYEGCFGSGYGPILLTLSGPANSLYTIGNQTFVITDAAQIDGFSNLDGTIEKENILYTLTLGPIIASNTTQGFEDDAPPQTVQNPVEFNETMISAPFTLSNNDTLLLGAYGKYLPSYGLAMQPLKYHVNLVDSATNQVHRLLFSDTINVDDSVGIEFLRGFVINNISGGTGRFYVQLLIDTADGGDGDYMMAGVYSDDSQPGGDAAGIYKTKVYFENSSNSVKQENQIPKSYDLSQNYPNPFNPVTKINYALPKQGFVTLKIYDITGREVKVLMNEFKQAGYYTVDFNGSNLASGVYFYRIQCGDFISVKKMVLVK